MPLDQTTWPPTETTEIDPTTDLLIRARGFIERGWCRDALALDAEGKRVRPRSDRAVAWCAHGALIAAGMALLDLDNPAVHRLTGGRDGYFLVKFNNTQKSVVPILAAFDRAIVAGT
jgi:hypothetical protein